MRKILTATPSRRNLLLAGAGLAASGFATLSGGSLSAAPAPGQVKAIGFDGFTIFDPRSLDTAFEQAFPGKGAQLAAGWRTRIFEYCWLRTLNQKYADFEQVLAESLDVTLQAAKVTASPQVRDDLKAAFVQFKPFLDSVAALRAMRSAGIRLAPQSQLTEGMLRTLSVNAGIADLFEFMLSTDRVRAYKPDPRAYAMAEQAFGLPRENIVFAAFGGWDAAGAKSFGLNTFWVNRFNVPADQLGAEPDATGSTLSDLQKYVIG